MVFPASNLMKFARDVVNELKKTKSKNFPQYLFLYSIYHCLMYKSFELITRKLDNFTKTLITIFLC